jgi:hypothetical protein
VSVLRRVAGIDIDASQADDRPAGASHPFVAEAAKLCLDGIASGVARQRVIWEAEGQATSQLGHRLSPESLRLVGDVALFLSLIFSRQTVESKPIRPGHPLVNGLPPCLAGEKRHLLLGEDSCSSHDCEFGLCPLSARALRHAARGEFTHEFCQSQIAAVGKVGRPHWTSSTTGDLTTFWGEVKRHHAAQGPVLQWWEWMAPDGDIDAPEADADRSWWRRGRDLLLHAAG